MPRFNFYQYIYNHAIKLTTNHLLNWLVFIDVFRGSYDNNVKQDNIYTGILLCPHSRSSTTW